MARERCTELCTKATTDQCALCDALDERNRFEQKYFWQFFCKEFYLKLYRFVFAKTLSFTIWLALFSLIRSVHSNFLDKGDFSSVLPSYIAVIALSIALASMTFTYSRTKDDEEVKTLVFIGELFINTALSLIVSFLITWMSFEIQKFPFIKKISSYVIIKTLLNFLIGFGYGALIAATICFHKGIIKLQKYISSEERRKTIDSTHKEKPSTIL